MLLYKLNIDKNKIILLKNISNLSTYKYFFFALLKQETVKYNTLKLLFLTKV